MNVFTKSRKKCTINEIWFLEHYPIFTTGQTENNNKLLYINNIPIMNANRGGKITYHGPGQQIIYLLFNLKEMKINIKQLLYLVDQIILSTLYYFFCLGHKNFINPGIYIKNKKICSIALRIKKIFCLHGLALNIITDLTPFKYISPCGNNKIKMDNISTFISNITLYKMKNILIKKFLYFFNKNIYIYY